jgi:hypothetical protein
MINRSLFLFAGLLVSLAACSDSDSSTSSGGTGGAGGTGAGAAGGGGGSQYAALYDCEEAAFGEAKPLSGPNFDLSMGGFLTEPTSDTFVVHATQIYFTEEQYDPFFAMAGKVIGELANTEGLIAWTVGSDDTCGVARTMGLWESEEALYKFIATGAHAEAMAKTTELSITGRTTHFTVTKEEAEALSWDVARQKLEAIEPSAVYE